MAFNTQMAKGNFAQRNGEHNYALSARIAAEEVAVTDVERGCAKRYQGTSYSELGKPIDAYSALEDSVTLLENAVPVDRVELYASIGQRAVAGLQVKLARQSDASIELPISLTGFSSAFQLDDAFNGIKNLESTENDGLPHQYRIALAGKRAAAKAYEGRRIDAVKAVMVAGSLALSSESLYNPSRNKELTLFEIFKSKARHITIAGLALVSALTPTKTSHKIIQKIL